MPGNRHISTPLTTDAGRLARVSEVVSDVSTRLAGVCSHLSHDEFDRLVRKIAEITVKYEVMAEARAARTTTPALPLRAIEDDPRAR